MTQAPYFLKGNLTCDLTQMPLMAEYGGKPPNLQPQD
jgi:hypothetical protein